MLVPSGPLHRFTGMWTRKPQEAPQAPPVNPWVTSNPGDGSGHKTESEGTPWAVVPEKPPALVRVGRIALWGAVGLLAAAGLRGLVAPPPSPAGPQAAPAPGPTAAAYPEDAARALAVRAAHAYLAWDEAKPEDRARELAAVLAAGVDPQLGWDGRGTQAVGLVVPGPVIPGRAGRARVRVDAQIAPGAGPVRWVAVEIPVAVAGGGRLVVSGPPRSWVSPSARPPARSTPKGRLTPRSPPRPARR
ncbi:hypothetical protein Sfulv_62330 [Streptomyces fulvorobeus]|uniref:Uncharacterized protein n=1 Tax=Streptomyces fulvorobeus TaxID=284028 RepID=A0A7J0CFY7_9ACTN|nr:hypothetical protein Sfulv_62330 [Streptomyces fulvorobeus]